MNKFMLYYTSSAVFLLGCFSLFVPSGYSIGSTLLLLGSISLLWRNFDFSLTADDKLILAVFATYSLFFIIQMLLENAGIRTLDRPFRFLFCMPVLFFIFAYPPKLTSLWSGLALGSILTGSLALWQKLVLNVDRAVGYTQVIQFGNLSMLFGLFCLAGLGWAVVQKNNKAWFVFLLVGACFGALGSLLSGSRGGWIGLPFIFLVLYKSYGSLLTHKIKFLITISLIFLVTSIYFIPQTGLKLRIDKGVNDIQLYVSGQSAETSLGYRFDMWKGALILIYEKPILGWGWHGYQEGMQDLADKGLVTQFAANNHAHNEFLDNQARRGLLGTLTLLGLYLIPLRLFLSRLKSSDLELKAVATAGAILPVAFIDYGLTQVFFGHNSGVMVYAFWLPILWGTMRSLESNLISRTRANYL